MNSFPEHTVEHVTTTVPSLIVSGCQPKLSFFPVAAGPFQFMFLCLSSKCQYYCVEQCLPYIGRYLLAFRRNKSVLTPRKWEIQLKKSYDSVRRFVLYNILTQFGIPVQMVRQIINVSECNLQQSPGR